MKSQQADHQQTFPSKSRIEKKPDIENNKSMPKKAYQKNFFTESTATPKKNENEDFERTMQLISASRCTIL